MGSDNYAFLIKWLVSFPPPTLKTSSMVMIGPFMFALKYLFVPNGLSSGKSRQSFICTLIGTCCLSHEGRGEPFVMGGMPLWNIWFIYVLDSLILFPICLGDQRPWGTLGNHMSYISYDLFYEFNLFCPSRFQLWKVPTRSWKEWWKLWKFKT